MVRIHTFSEQINGISLSQKNFIQQKTPSKELRKELILEVVRRSLVELAVSLALTGIALFFVATPIGMAVLLTCTIVAIAINVLLRSGAAYFKYRLFQLQYDNSIDGLKKRETFQLAYNILQYLIPGTFSAIVDSNTREKVVHQGGHFLFAKLLFNNSQAKTTIKPLESASTSYHANALTKVGEAFGKTNSKLIVAAAGPALSVISAAVTLGTSLALRKTHPELSRYLKVIAVDSIFMNASYALSALWTAATKKSHDFLQLMTGGIHPIVSIISIIALPLIVRIGFFIHDKIKERLAEKAALQNPHLHKNYMIKLPSRKLID